MLANLESGADSHADESLTKAKAFREPEVSENASFTPKGVLESTAVRLALGRIENWFRNRGDLRPFR